MRQRDSVIQCSHCREIGYTIWRRRLTEPDGTPRVAWAHEVEPHGAQLPPLGPGLTPTCPSCGHPMAREICR